MRDNGRINCYRAEWALGRQPQEDWATLMEVARAVVRDPVVKVAYPELTRRPLKLRPVMAHLAKYVGQYHPTFHRVSLTWGGRDKLTLLHEMAHACVPGGHGMPWRKAYIFLVWRFMGEEMGLRLTASFLNEGALKRQSVRVEPVFEES